jgi:hypothetical protein
MSRGLGLWLRHAVGMALFVLSGLSVAGEAAIAFTGDARAAVAIHQRDLADGTTATELLPALRLRPGIDVMPGSAMSFGFRLAALLNRDMHGLQFDADGPADPGVIAVDSAYLQFKPSDRLQARVGRFQTTFELDSVVEDGLSRHDSGGVAVDWTDGVHIALGEARGTRLHYIGQFNRNDRSTNGVGARGPVTFENGASRVTHFIGLELAPSGSLTQAMIDMTWIPNALADGTQDGRGTRDFLSFTARIAADHDVAVGRVLHPALEIGWMPITPQLESLGFASRSGHASGLALVAGLDIRPLARGALGLQLARIPAGFIASPDYPANSRSAELRYSWWPVESRLKLDLRYRVRQQILRTSEADSRQTAHNLQLRATLRF